MCKRLLVGFCITFCLSVLMAAVPTAHAAPMARIVAAAIVAEFHTDVPAETILAVIAVESNFDPRALGSDYPSVGLMQLRPKFHKASWNIEANVMEGAQYLSYVRKHCQSKFGEAWVVGYNAGPFRELHNPFHFPYYRKYLLALAQRRWERTL